MISLLFQLLLALLALTISYKVAILLYNKFYSPLRNIPGPIVARLTDLWYVNRIRKGHFERDNIALHRKYDSVVRYGPKGYSVEHPEAAQVIYGIGKADKFAKSYFFRAFTTPNPDQPSVFAHENIKEHAQLRRLYQSTHAMSALISYEGFVDYMITYSKRLGFLNQGVDIAWVMESLEGFLSYASVLGVYPRLHPLLFHVRNCLAGNTGSGIQYVLQFTEKLMKEHQAKPKNLDLDDKNKQRMDFLSKYVARHRKDPLTYNDWYVLSRCASNMTAGSDTTGISLSAIMYFLITSPKVLGRLRQEVAKHQERALHPRHFSFKEVQGMEYLQAVIKEGLRLHPAVGQPLERIVRKGGATITGQFFPEGTIVGVNCWVEHYSSAFFGPDPDAFRPERWLDSDKLKLEVMNSHWMAFGMGARTCIGRHISILEISKLIPRLNRDFDFTFPEGAKEFKTNNR
ncbi:Biphenyl-2,3-diol 1,2-dioxygenase 3 [Fusarium oxysporum f. sp. albedinis]|nr:Biphenyl-2,3-diol 1,2-dioxygenase 3 [Fusarium oxysporum f. sp. albedinis]